MPPRNVSAMAGGATSWRSTLRPRQSRTTGIHATKGVAGWMRENRSRKSLSNIRQVCARSGRAETGSRPTSPADPRTSWGVAGFAFPRDRLKRSGVRRNVPDTEGRASREQAYALSPRVRAKSSAGLDAGRGVGNGLVSRMAGTTTSRALLLTARSLARLGREFARSARVTPQQAETISLLLDRGSVSTSSLAALLGIDPSTASRNLAALDRAGLIGRRRVGRRGRQPDLAPRPAGRRGGAFPPTPWPP